MRAGESRFPCKKQETSSGTEAFVLRKLSFLAALVGAAILCAPARAQEQQQSLADAARQARKDKDDKAKDKDKSAAKPKTVYTEDTLGGGNSGSGLGLGVLPTLKTTSDSGAGTAASSGAGASGAGASGGNLSPSSMIPGASGSSDPVAAAYEGIDKAEAALNRLDPMDRATLAKTALDGNDVDFPGRRAWEEKLFANKQVYVSRSRQLLQQMQGIMSSATSGGSQQDLMSRAQTLQQAATQVESTFQAVITEGQNLAKQAKSH
jgi:hypothetical protein